MSKPRAAALLSLIVAVVALAGCGDDDETTATDGTTATEAATVDFSTCTPDQLETKTPGTLTVATDDPAFPPYFEDNDPTNGEGFESATAYAIADQLGYSEDDVEWTVEAFNSSFAPGPKDFDFDVNEISITPKRAEQVDFSTPVLRGRAGRCRAQGLRRRLSDLARRPRRREHRRPDRHHEPRRRQRVDPAVGGAAGLRHLE